MVRQEHAGPPTQKRTEKSPTSELRNGRTRSALRHGPRGPKSPGEAPGTLSYLSPGEVQEWWPLLPRACRNDRPMQPAEGRIRGGPHLRSEESLFNPRFARPRRPPISCDPGWAQDVSGLVRCRWSVHLLLPAFRRQKQASEPQNRTRLVQTQVRAMWVVGRAVSVVKP